MNAIYESMNGNFSEGYVVMMQDPTGETDSSLLHDSAIKDGNGTLITAKKYLSSANLPSILTSMNQLKSDAEAGSSCPDHKSDMLYNCTGLFRNTVFIHYLNNDFNSTQLVSNKGSFRNNNKKYINYLKLPNFILRVIQSFKTTDIL